MSSRGAMADVCIHSHSAVCLSLNDGLNAEVEDGVDKGRRMAQ